MVFRISATQRRSCERSRSTTGLGREAFLDRYQFGPARSYFLVHDGRRYDSKAIAGAAYGYQFPTEGSLSREDFSGGEATVATKLRRLGFTVEQDPGAHRNPTWATDELILALDLYVRAGLLDDSDTQVQELSELKPAADPHRAA